MNASSRSIRPAGRTAGAAFATVMAVALPVALAGESATAAAQPIEPATAAESKGLVQRLSQAVRHFVDAAPCVQAPQALFTLDLERAPTVPAVPTVRPLCRAWPALIDLPPPTR